VDIEACTDAGGGYDVGWTAAGEWLAYNVAVTTTGQYTLTARMASGNAGAKTMTVTLDGASIGAFTTTDASGWQSWKDIVVSNVNLTAGNHSLRINMTTAGFNINYLNVAAQVPTPGALQFSSAAYTIAENGANATITVNRTGGSSGSVTVNYATANGTATAGADYTAASGTLTFANGVTSQTFTVPILDDAVVEPNETVTLTISNTTGGATLGSPTSATLTIIDNDGVTGINLPGRIQAENYKNGGEGVGYHDADAGNTGGAYRTDGVDIQATTDVGGGYNVGWTVAGEWLAYDVSVTTAGLYDLTARIASGTAGTKTLTVTLDGATIGTFTTTDASGWQSWKDVKVTGVNLANGNHALRMTMTTAGINLNYLDVATQGPAIADIARGKTATASSVENGTYPASNAVDGNSATRWSSAFSDPQWITIDLGASYSISAVVLNWEAACAKNYTIRLSADNANWTILSTKTNMAAGARRDSIPGLSGIGRYIQMNGTARNTVYGYSLFDFRVYGAASAMQAAPGATPAIVPKVRRTDWKLDLCSYSDGKVRFTLPKMGEYRITAFTLAGEKAALITKANGAFGPNTLMLSLSKGVYIMRLSQPGLRHVDKKVNILK
jgi:hypothetical protein